MPADRRGDGRTVRKGREQQVAKLLLHWGQQNFDTVQVLQKGQKVGQTERIWYGDKEQIARQSTRFLVSAAEGGSIAD